MRFYCLHWSNPVKMLCHLFWFLWPNVSRISVCLLASNSCMLTDFNRTLNGYYRLYDFNFIFSFAIRKGSEWKKKPLKKKKRKENQNPTTTTTKKHCIGFSYHNTTQTITIYSVVGCGWLLLFSCWTVFLLLFRRGRGWWNIGNKLPQKFQLMFS